MKKTLSLIIFLFSYGLCFSQTMGAPYEIPSISGMLTYNGTQKYLFIRSTSQVYVLCTVCTPNGTTIYQGFGSKKWQKLSDSAKQDVLVSGNTIKTINDESILGSGNIIITGGGGTIDDEPTFGSSNAVASGGVYLADADLENQINNKEDLISPTNTGDYYRGDKSMQPLTQDAVQDGVTNRSFTDIEKDKLAGIAAGATNVIVDATLTDGSTNAIQNNAVFDGLAIKQPLDADLTTIAGLTATTNNFIVSESSAWASRTPAQVKTTLSLENVSNTSDANKPVSTAQQTAIDAKADTMRVNQPNYVIEKIGSTYYARPAYKTNYPAYSGTNSAQIINLAIAAMSSGGTIYFKQGTYTITQEIKDAGYDNVSLIFEKGAKLVAGNGFQTAAFDSSMIHLTAVDNWLIDGIEMDGNRANQVSFGSSSDQSAIFVENGTNIHIVNANIYECIVFGICFFETCTNSGVKDSYITGCGWNAITLGNYILSNNLYSIHNDISHCSDMGVASYSQNYLITDNYIHDMDGNTGDVNAQWGIGIENNSTPGAGGVISNNWIQNTASAIDVDVDMSNVIISNNRILNSALVSFGGVIHLSSNYNIVEGNTIITTNTNAAGVLIGGFGNIVKGNRLEVKTGVSLNGAAADRNIIEGNSFKSSARGVYVFDATCDQNRIQNNDFDESVLAVEDNAATTIYSNNIWTDGTLRLPSFASPNVVAGTLPIANGGTNLTTYTTGDIPYASATNILSKLAVGSNGDIMTISGGVPAWSTTPALPSGSTATTQTLDNNSTAISTTAYTDQTFQRRVAYLEARGNGTSIDVLGFPNTGAQGTPTTRNAASTNLFTRQRRVGYLGATSANARAGVLNFPGLFYPDEGYVFRGLFGITAYNSGHSYYAGVCASPVASTQPSVQTQMILFYADAGDANFKIRSHNGTTASSVVDLGANFPSNTSATDWYDVTFKQAAGASTATYKVLRVNTGHTASGTLSIAPATGTAVGPQILANCYATVVAADIAISRVYMITDY